MSDKKRVPKLRFPGFTEPWEQRKLGEIATYRNGKAHEANQLDVGTYELVNLNSISIDGGLKPSGKFIEDGSDTLQRNDLVMVLSDVGHGDLLGRVAIIPENNRYVLNQRVALLRINDDTNTYFLFSIINRYQDYFKKLGAGSSQLNISRGIVENFEVAYPNVAEQRMIADYFQSLDHLITLHQRKLEHVKKMKKSMLQKMFPKKNQLYPEVRFPGFTDAWEQRKLPEFVSFFNGLTYTPDDVQETGTLVLRSSNVKNGEIVDADNVYVSDEVVTSENVKEGDIIVVVRNGSRALIGKHAQIKASMPNTVIGAFMSGIRSEHSSFVNALLDTSAFENEIAKNMGATINQITGYMFSKMEFMIPSGEEQDKIGAYFKQLDHLITLHQRELDHLQLLKKGMLQQMFI